MPRELRASRSRANRPMLRSNDGPTFSRFRRRPISVACLPVVLMRKSFWTENGPRTRAAATVVDQAFPFPSSITKTADVSGAESPPSRYASTGGAVLAWRAFAANRSIRVFEEKFSEIFGRFGICLARMLPRCGGRRLPRCDKRGTLQKLLRQTPLQPSHQYGLQIAEGMVTFFESYERAREKYWTKMLLLQLS